MSLASPDVRSSGYAPDPERERRGRMWRHAIGIAGFGALLLACMLLQANEDSVSTLGVPLPDICMMKRVTGLSCPGCGLTRCFVQMGHGEFRRAWSMSPAGTLFFLLLVAQIPLQAIQLWLAYRGRPDPIRNWNGLVLVVFGGLLIGQWFWRIALGQLPP